MAAADGRAVTGMIGMSRRPSVRLACGCNLWPWGSRLIARITWLGPRRGGAPAVPSGDGLAQELLGRTRGTDATEG